jgi:hypothetical protein
MTLTVDEKARLYLLTLHRGEVSQVLGIDPRSLRVVRSEVRGLRTYGLEYENFKEHGGALLPHELTLRAPSADTSLGLKYTEITVNESPDLTLFDLSAPEDVPVVDVDEGGQALPPVELPPARPDA